MQRVWQEATSPCLAGAMCLSLCKARCTCGEDGPKISQSLNRKRCVFDSDYDEDSLMKGGHTYQPSSFFLLDNSQAKVYLQGGRYGRGW